MSADKACLAAGHTVLTTCTLGYRHCYLLARAPVPQQYQSKLVVTPNVSMLS